MSERGADFLVSWVESNVDPDSYPPQGDRVAAQAKADECRAAAEAHGLTAAEIEAEVGPLAGYMHVMMSAPTDRALVQVGFEDAPLPSPQQTTSS